MYIHIRNDSLYLRNLGKALAASHQCEGTHISTAYVHEIMDGKTVWEGDVEVFSIEGLPKTDKAFAWGYKDEKGDIYYIAVLAVPPIISPREAVKAVIANGEMQ